MRIPGFRYLKSFSVYAFVMFFTAAITFAVYSWLTHHLSTKDLGIVNLYNAYCLLLVPFVSFGVQFILSVDYFKMPAKRYAIRFVNGLLIPPIAIVLLTLLSLLFQDKLLGVLQSNLFFVLIAPLTCFFIGLNDIVIMQIRNRGKHGLYARYSIFKTVSESLLIVLLISVFAVKWQGRLSAALISLVICSGFSFYLFKKWDLIKCRIFFSEIKRIAHASSPFIPERLAVFFLSQSDRFIINYYHGTSELGLYGAGAQVGIIVNLVTMALSYSFQPMIFKNLSLQPVNYRGCRNVMLGYMGISLMITLVLIVAIPFIFHWFIGEAFKGSGLYAINLTIAGFFWAVYNCFLACLLFLKKSREIMWIAIGGTFISVSLNLISIKQFGPVGATYTCIIVYFIMAVLVMLRVHKYYNIRNFFARG